MELLVQYDATWLCIFVLVAFFAGYIDAIAGGGGMLQVPTLLLGGLSPVGALATNKIISMTGTCFVVFRYTVGKFVIWRIVGIAAVPCTLAAIAGSQIAIITPNWLLEVSILVSIAVALAVSVFVKPQVLTPAYTVAKRKVLFWLTSIGLYDGMAGPGTGTFFVLATNRITGHNLVTSTAISKPINLLTNIGASAMFISAGKVNWSVAIPMLVANSLGGWFGARMAIYKGSEFIRKILIYVLIAMLIVNVFYLF